MHSTPYKLFLDIQAHESKFHRNRGIPRYVGGHARALVQRGCVAALGLHPMKTSAESLHPELARSELLTWTTVTELRRRSISPLAFHIMSPFESGPLDSVAPAFIEETPIVATLYDLIPLLYPSTYLPDADIQVWYRERLQLIERADVVLAISRNTRDDALRLLHLDPERVAVIGAGVSDGFRPAGSGEHPERMVRFALPSITRPFVLCVAGADPRKNVGRLIEAFAELPQRLRRQFQLVVVCALNDEFKRSWEQARDEVGLATDDLVLTGYVADDVLRALYQSASLSVFPSLYEGFGLPVAEAAACGCPTITSNTSSVPEVLEFDEATFDPLDADSMAGVTHRALTDDGFRDALRRAARSSTEKNTWDAVAGRTIGALALLPPPSPAATVLAPAVPRLRLALVGPFPPLRSGVADYNRRLASELAKLCRLDLLVTKGSNPRPAFGDDQPRVFDLEELGASLNPASYDAIVYTFGNSLHHYLTLDKAVAYTGVVWFHDVRLAGFYLSYGWTRQGEQGLRFMADKLERFYGGRLPPHLAAASVPIEDYHRYNLGMTVELLNSARGAIVSSEFARRLLELDQGAFVIPPPIEVIPLAVPAPPRAFAVRREEVLIGVFGIGSMHKAPDLVIEALALVRQEVSARLVFVGPYEEGLRRELAALARAKGVTEAVEFPGDVDEAAYWTWLGRVTCAVQVRRQIHGESSAAVSDCLGAGTPVVTNLVSCRELPANAVELLPEEFSPAELADRLMHLLSDAAHRESMAGAARRWAEINTFDRVAAKVLRFVTSLDTTHEAGAVGM